MRIRRHVRFLCFLTLSVALLFGIRELPELMSLADDVTNDGEIAEVVTSDVFSVKGSDGEHREPTAYASRPRVVVRFSPCFFLHTLIFRPGKSLLELLGVLRV